MGTYFTTVVFSSVSNAWKIVVIAPLVSQGVFSTHFLYTISLSRMEDNAPIILYMEWSKNAKPVPLEETEEIEIVTAPDADSIRLREEVGIMKLKHESLCDQKEQLLRLLNDVSDSVGNGRSTCEALDSICGQITERIGSTSVSLSRETKVCDELASRIQRDKNKSIIGEVAERISLNHDEFQIMEFLQSQLSQSGDPDDLLTSFSSYYDHCHKRLKRELKSVAQLKSVVHSLKKEITETEQRLVIAERAKKIPVAQKPAPLKKHKPLVVDRKVSIPKPLSAVNTEYADDDLGRSRVRASTFFN